MNLIFELFLFLIVIKKTFMVLQTLALDEMEASGAKYILHRPLAQKGKPVFFASEIIKKYICYRPDK